MKEKYIKSSNKRISEIVEVMSFEEVSDLFEFDDFDCYDENTYRTILTTNRLVEEGVPLSIELSETLNRNQNTVNEHSDSSDFVKASEIFLRLETSGTETSKSLAEVNTIETTDSLISASNQEECIELQYENEFIGPNDEPDLDFLRTARDRTNSIYNDYEELLFEGTNFEK